MKKQHMQGCFVSFSLLFTCLLMLVLFSSCASAWDPMGISALRTPTSAAVAGGPVAAGPVPGGSSTSVVGSPTISASLITQVLTTYHSPAATMGQSLYDEGVKYQIDPAFALAFFFHESAFGTRGEARSSLSLGNLRCITGYTCRDGYAWFPSWQVGFAAWYALIAGPLYVGDHLTTVEQIIPRYAPPADNNDVSAYVQAIALAVTSWRRGQVTLA